MRLIDADELINKLNKSESDVHGSAECYSSVTEITETIEYVGILIDETPTVEAVPVVHAEWIHVPSSDMATGQAYECSNCKKMRYGSFLPPFCQMCGADMRKKV